MSAPRTLNELFFRAVDAFGNRPAAMRSRLSGAWTDLSYADLLDQVQSVSNGMRELGVPSGGHVAILAENRPEWAIADFACLTGRCADVPVYPTLPAGQIAYILKNSEASTIFVSNEEQLAKIREVRRQLPALKHVIIMDRGLEGDGVIAFTELVRRGRAARSSYPRWREEALEATPGDLATLIYTSGTTGDPKGVMLTHGNITFNVIKGLEVLPLKPTDECLSFLPLSHIFERMAGHYVMFHAGAIINYALSIDTVSEDMVDRKPTVVLSVPRLYEKIYARVLENALSGSGIKKRIFFWARSTAESWANRVLAGKSVPGSLELKKKIADKLVFSKLQARTGGRLRFFVSGGAPLSADIAKFFFAAGLPILEGYGLTETSPVIAVNTFEKMKLGTVGPPLPGVEVRIADDGEILTRSPSVMKGYYRNPEATAAMIDEDGWLHTGDIGELDAEGFLRITDRKKDILVTAGGKNIAPQPIEGRVKSSKFVANAVMLGDKRRFPIMLIVPNLENLKAWAREDGLVFGDVPSLIEHPKAIAKMEREMAKQLRDLAHFEMPKKILVLAEDFSIEGGELTPTLKVKRRVVEDRYKEEIEKLYAEREGGVHDLDGKA